MSKTQSGHFGEKLAAEFLKKRGYRIVDKNFHSRYGEIDLITLQGNCLVYVEVKARWNRGFGLPEEAISKRKLDSIRTTAAFYRSLNPDLPQEERIDAVVIEFNDQNNETRIELIENIGQF